MMLDRSPETGRFLPEWFGSDDPFDPRTWGCDVPYKPIWLDPQNNLACIVDSIDYDHLSEWTWTATPDKHRRKWYATRTTWALGRRIKIYLHKVVCHLAHGEPPTPRHHIGDHDDGNSLDCRRHNLHWATPGMNRRNIHGLYARQLRLGL